MLNKIINISLIILAFYSCGKINKSTTKTQTDTEISELETITRKTIEIETAPADSLRGSISLEKIITDTIVVFQEGEVQTRLKLIEKIVYVETDCGEVEKKTITEETIQTDTRTNSNKTSNEKLKQTSLHGIYKFSLWFMILALIAGVIWFRKYSKKTILPF